MSEFAFVLIFVGVFVAIRLSNYVTTWMRLLQVDMYPVVVDRSSAEDVPPEQKECIDAASAQLRHLGFEAIEVSRAKRQSMSDYFYQVYVHRRLSTYAAVSARIVLLHPHPYHIEFVTLFSDGGTVRTVDCYAHYMLEKPPTHAVADGYVGDPEKQWKVHLEAVERLGAGRSTRLPAVDAFRQFENKLEEETFDHNVRNGMLARKGSAYRVRLWPGLRLATRFVRGTKMQQKVSEGVRSQHPSVPSVQNYLFLFQEMQESERRVGTSGWGVKLFWLLLTIFLFTFSFGSTNTLQRVLIIVAAVLIHELGHLMAMVLFGYKDTRILFIPFLGAVTLGKNQNATPLQKVIVYLMGPLPGYFIGACAFYFAEASGSQFWTTVVLTFVGINLLNLLPILPLDGGRIVETLFLHRFPFAQSIFLGLSVGLIVLAAIFWASPVLLVLAVLLSMAIPTQLRFAKVYRQLVAENGRWTDERSLLEAIFTFLTADRYRSMPEGQRLTLARSLLSNLTAPPTTARDMVIGGLLYAFGFLGPFVAAIAIVVASLLFF